MCIVAVEVVDQLQGHDRGVSRERVLEGVVVGFLGCIQKLILECGVDVSTLFILKTLIRVLPDEFLIIEMGFPHWYGGHSSRVDPADKRDWADERVLHHHQDKPKVVVLENYAGNLDRHRIPGEETMSVSDGSIVWFTRLLGGVWGWGAFNR